MYTSRNYRSQVSSDLAGFTVRLGETDLHIGASRPLVGEAEQAVRECRRPLEHYLAAHPGFAGALLPWDCGPQAPPPVQAMCRAGLLAGVGPMAAVAGAIAECVGRRLLAHSDEIIVENGGDLFLASARPRRVRIFAGPSPLSDRLAIVIPPTSGLGVCTSSRSVGPSLSFGRADSATVISLDTALADAAATTLGNLVQQPADLARALRWVAAIPGVLGCLAIIGDRLGALGQVELEPLG